MNYRIFIWSAETGGVKKKLEYQRLELAKERAIQHSENPGVKEVSVCPINDDGGPGPRVGVAAHGQWADGVRAPQVQSHRRVEDPALKKVKRRRKT